MKWSRERAGSQPSTTALAREDARVEAILQTEVVLHADAPRERDELGAAREEYMLAVIDFDAVDFERGGAAAEQTAPLEKLDAQRPHL